MESHPRSTAMPPLIIPKCPWYHQKPPSPDFECKVNRDHP
jgi:hypothetical protein